MGELYNPFPKLPKNIRQIGDADHVIRFYMEDYVNTYLKRLYPIGKRTMRVGVLLGSVEQYEGMPYIFVDGAMEMEDVELDGEKVMIPESSWKKVYAQMEHSFPKRTIQGWFLCGGPGSQLSPLNYWKQHSQHFAGKNQLMYLNHGLDGDESIYITSEDGFYRLKGHCIYYERNQMMQDYMVTRKDVRRVESGAQETVIRDFRSRISAKKEQAAVQNRTANVMGALCGILAVAVLAGGVALVNNYSKMQKMESVLASVLPSGMEHWDEKGKNIVDEFDFMIEEMKGEVQPTKETGEIFGTETNESDTASEAGDSDNSALETSRGNEESVGMHEEQEHAETNAVTGNASAESVEATQPLVGIDKENGQAGHVSSAMPVIDYAAASANGYRIYEIEKGETLYGICWKHYGNLNNLAEICRLNNLSNVDRILAGQKLILP